MITSRTMSRNNSIFSTMHRPSTTTARNPEPLPPDVAAARKARINQDLIEIFNMPCPPGTIASAQGIGLYTHVLGPPPPAPKYPHEKYKKVDPVFLPIGGPIVFKKAGGVGAPIDEAVNNVWKQIEAAVVEEEKHASQGGTAIEHLKERYDALEVPIEHINDAQAHAQAQAQPQLLQLLGQLSNIAMAGGGSALDAVMGGMEQERRGSAVATRTGNLYEEDRDPRRRGR
jgi:hypothetical protein